MRFANRLSIQLLFLVVAVCGKKNQQPSQPNIIFLLVDDMGIGYNFF